MTLESVGEVTVVSNLKDLQHVNEIISSQKLLGILDKLTSSNLGRQHHRSLSSYVKSSSEYLYLFCCYKLLCHTIYMTYVFVFPR